MIVEGKIVKRGFMSYAIDTGKGVVPIYSSKGRLWSFDVPSWNTFGGLAKTSQRVRVEGIYRRVLTRHGMRNAFIAVRYI